jgi:hypothetical protein
MGKLFLDSLEIQNFRGFRHLQIEKLGRVNLIVGRNNIGKTALLEALHLYARKDGSSLVWEMLQARDELRKPLSQTDIDDLLEALKYLFLDCKDVRKYADAILIGPMHSPSEVLKISVERVDVGGTSPVKPLSYEEMLFANLPHLRFQWGEMGGVSYPVMPDTAYGFLGEGVPLLSSIFLSAGGLSKESIVDLWDNIALTAFEKDVIEALRILAPGIEGINFVGDTPARRGSVFRMLVKESVSQRSRIPIVRIASEHNPLPLRNLGNGMLHILEIILALINSQDGLFLMDEVENGIHYSAQQEIWQMIFRLADRLNVQVFATTHSWDCIEGFQKAVAKDKQEEGLLIRLSLKGDDEMKVTSYDERRLEIATRERIEVR